MSKNNTLIQIDSTLHLQTILKHSILDKIITELSVKKITQLFEPNKLIRYCEYFTLLIGNTFSVFTTKEETILDLTDTKLMAIIYGRVKIIMKNLIYAHLTEFKDSFKLDLPMGFEGKSDALSKDTLEDFKTIVRNFDAFLLHYHVTYPSKIISAISNNKIDMFKQSDNERKAYDTLDDNLKFLLNILVSRTNLEYCKDEYGLPLLAEARRVHHNLLLIFKDIQNENDFWKRYHLKGSKKQLWIETVSELHQIMKLMKVNSLDNSKNPLFLKFIKMCNSPD